MSAQQGGSAADRARVESRLSGGMDACELRKFFIAATATPDDFRITANGTYDRRDGVTDKETYRTLRMAMNTMKFSQAEQRDVFSITAAHRKRSVFSIGVCFSTSHLCQERS